MIAKRFEVSSARDHFGRSCNNLGALMRIQENNAEKRALERENASSANSLGSSLLLTSALNSIASEWAYLVRSRLSFCTRSRKASRLIASSWPCPFRRGATVPASASRGPTTSM